MSTESNSKTGSWVVGAIFIVFLFLKLAGIGMVASWSWWWVFSPIWITAAFVLLLLIIYLIIIVLNK